MDCPHCCSEIDVKPHAFALGEDQDGSWQVSNVRCPVCDRLIVNVCTKQGASYPAWPQTSWRPRPAADVPADYADEYLTACRVLPYSAEASATLSRRLLHRLLAVKTAAGHGGFSDQIRQAVIASDLPPYLKQALQTLVRVAKLEPGSSKSEKPDTLTPAEPGEPEWLLDIVEAMFDLYFVRPAHMERKQVALEESIGCDAELQPAPGPQATATTTPAAPSAAEATTSEGDAANPGTPTA